MSFADDGSNLGLNQIKKKSPASLTCNGMAEGFGWFDVLLYGPLVGLIVFSLFILERYLTYRKVCKKVEHIPGYEQFLPPAIASMFPKWLLPKDYFTTAGEFVTIESMEESMKKFGTDHFKVVLGFVNIPLVIVDNPDMGKEIATKGTKIYRKNAIDKKTFIELFSASNIFSETDQQVWSHQRHLIDPSFAPESLRMVADVTTSIMLEEMIPSIDKQLKSRDVMTDFAKLTMDVIGKAGFGYSFDSFHNQNNGLEEKTNNFLKYFEVVKLLPSEYLRRNFRVGIFGKLHDAIDSFRVVIKDIIAKREREENNGDEEQYDVLSLLLKDRKNQTNIQASQDGALSDDELIALIVILLVAGHETTARTLGFALYFLAKNPQVQKELQDGLDLFVKTYKKDTFDYEDFTSGRLDFVKAVFKETLRLLPVAVGIVREMQKSVLWEDKVTIPKGAFTVYTWTMSQRSPKYWDKAEEFIPSRFLKKDETSGQLTVFNPQTNPFVYTPFGIGGRICIGKNFAEVEAVMALAYLAHRYQFKLTNPYYKMDLDVRVTLRPKETLLVDLEPRY